MIYLDNAATTYPKPVSVYDVMDKVNRTSAVNSGRGSYKIAREMTALIDETRTRLLSLFNAEGIADIVFTPSVTHAFNQVLEGLKLDEGSVVYTSMYEHNAVARTLEKLREEKGVAIAELPLCDDGTIDIEGVRFAFAKTTPSAVVLTALSNVTGYVTPYNDVFELAKAANSACVTILDAAQAAGLLSLNMKQEPIDILCFAGHKTLYGPFGIAGFALRKGVDLAVTFTGGTGSDSLNKHMPETAPGKYEAASPNIVAIAGLHEALAKLDVSKHYKTLKSLTEYLFDELSSIKKVHVLGYSGNNIGIISFVVDGYMSSDVGAILDDEYDIAVRTGYHCAPDIHTILNDKFYGGTVRVGIGMFNSKDDLDKLIEALESL